MPKSPPTPQVILSPGSSRASLKLVRLAWPLPSQIWLTGKVAGFWMQFPVALISPCGAASLNHGSLRAGQAYSLESNMSTGRASPAFMVSGHAAIRAVGAFAEAAQVWLGAGMANFCFV